MKFLPHANIPVGSTLVFRMPWKGNVIHPPYPRESRKPEGQKNQLRVMT